MHLPLDIRKVNYYVWFQVSLHFCLRGGELQSKLKPSDLEFTSIVGEDAVVLGHDFMSKNHRCGLSGSSAETARAVADAEQIAVFHRYLSKMTLCRTASFSEPATALQSSKKTEKRGS